MKNKTFIVNSPIIWLKITALGLLSLIIIGISLSIKDTMRTPYFIVIIISIIVLLSLTLIQSCILQYQYMQFDKQTKIIIDYHSEEITYIRNNVYLEFKTSDITNFHKVRNENSRRIQEFYYLIYIREQKVPLIITCVLSSYLEKYIKKKCHSKIANSMFLDKDKYDILLNDLTIMRPLLK